MSQADFSMTELARASAFRRKSDRDDFIAAHVLARVCVAGLVDARPIDVVLAQRCEHCGGEHGRPYIPDAPRLSVSWSHAPGYVAAAAAEVPIGVDVEVLGRIARLTDILDNVLHATEAAAVRSADDPDRAFLLQWVRRECLVKLGLVTLDTLPEIRPLDLPTVPQQIPAELRTDSTLGTLRTDSRSAHSAPSR